MLEHSTIPEAANIDRACDIVAAYVSKNPVSIADLPKLIADVHGSIAGLGPKPAEPVAELRPAVPIGKSVTPDLIICLEDGKKFRSLKRHISTLGMTPEQYREKWGLPKSYPMVAPNYSATRSHLAKANGLGRNRASAMVQ